MVKNILVLVFIFLGFSFIFSAKAGEANHLVISAVQITEGDKKADHDFIEIYNPTSSDINLKGYRLVKRTKVGTSDTGIKSWDKDAFIQARGWRLWASSNDADFPISLSADDFTSQTISADNGIAIRFGKEDAGEIIDSVAWGAASNAFKEGSIPANPGISEALIRKPGNGSNGEDSNNNVADFFISNNYKPQNSNNYSPSAAPAPISATPTPMPNRQNSIAGSSNARQNIIAEAGSDKEAAVGENVLFDGSDSIVPDGKDSSYVWFFNDGMKAEGASVSHVFNSAGEFVVVLKVSVGSAAGEDSLKIKVFEPEFSDRVVISEILPDPKGADKDGEWIELFNSGDKSVNLKGWKLDDEINGGSKPYVFSENTFIKPKGFFIIKRSESGIVLPNKGGEVNLLWYDDKNISKVSYGEAAEGKSYAYINGAWQWTENPSPGRENARTVMLGENNQTANSAKSNDKRKGEISVSGRILKANGISGSDTETAMAEIPRNTAGVEDDSGSSVGKQNNIPAENNGSVARQNPWFWGNMGLSIVSLFLVWRYQSLKKRAG